ncbi:putative TOS1-like glycosyl hydrolase-domain-containing protein [Sphaerosporella brunnea]|uniref:glucan endo-1,3-beta-D-glucosidase n=1 Tax=Sphaerosporella brunnea TaxID=1250544 RepID=A0A5J5EIR2_9PEZI|nr:putative TOS1-like glycosyl hydrolase-domain-containing protein [Sphaerosporella brunnea]
MRQFVHFLSIGLLALTTHLGSAAASGCQTINSIQYCNAADAITYDNIQGSGTYQDVASMDPSTCACNKAPKAYSGVLSPLDEQLSLHFRGPISLKQFGVYYPSGSAQAKRYVKRTSHFMRHHQHHRRGGVNTEKLEPPTKHRKAASNSLQRTAYYDSSSQTAQGLVFMNHMGGQGSGVFDHCWGNSISYMNSQNTGGCAKPEVLADITLPSNTEFIVFSDEKCNGFDDCGYYRPNVPAYRGFDGKNKVFVFEFQMPADGAGGFNGNMPAIWALNAKIPRTNQYGDCSCWGSGCGELDMFEVLQDATDFVTTHYHAAQGGIGGKYGGGGSTDYFKRPFDKCVKAAAIFDDAGSVTIKILPDNIEFSPSLDLSTLTAGDNNASVFHVPS